jgi:hypothetical protein
MRLLILLASVLALPVAAREPPPEYFTGPYQRVGRTGGDSPELLNDRVRLDPLPDGQGVALRRCQGGGTAVPAEPPLELRPDPEGEVPNILQGKEGPFALWCQYFNDYGNYPVLVCASDMGAAFTLTAATDDLACPPP